MSRADSTFLAASLNAAKLPENADAEEVEEEETVAEETEQSPEHPLPLLAPPGEPDQPAAEEEEEIRNYDSVDSLLQGGSPSDLNSAGGSEPTPHHRSIPASDYLGLSPAAKSSVLTGDQKPPPDFDPFWDAEPPKSPSVSFAPTFARDQDSHSFAEGSLNDSPSRQALRIGASLPVSILSTALGKNEPSPLAQSSALLDLSFFDPLPAQERTPDSRQQRSDSLLDFGQTEMEASSEAHEAAMDTGYASALAAPADPETDFSLSRVPPLPPAEPTGPTLEPLDLSEQPDLMESREGAPKEEELAHVDFSLSHVPSLPPAEPTGPRQPPLDLSEQPDLMENRDAVQEEAQSVQVDFSLSRVPPLPPAEPTGPTLEPLDLSEQPDLMESRDEAQEDTQLVQVDFSLSRVPPLPPAEPTGPTLEPVDLSEQPDLMQSQEPVPDLLPKPEEVFSLSRVLPQPALSVETEPSVNFALSASGQRKRQSVVATQEIRIRADDAEEFIDDSDYEADSDFEARILAEMKADVLAERAAFPDEQPPEGQNIVGQSIIFTDLPALSPIEEGLGGNSVDVTKAECFLCFFLASEENSETAKQPLSTKKILNERVDPFVSQASHQVRVKIRVCSRMQRPENLISSSL